MSDDVTSSVLAITAPPTRDVFGEEHDILLLCRAPNPRILISLAHFSVAVEGNLF